MNHCSRGRRLQTAFAGKPCLECLEQRLMLDGTPSQIPSIVMSSLATVHSQNASADSQTLSLIYAIENPPDRPFQVGIYRSGEREFNTGSFDYGQNEWVASQEISEPDLIDKGVHTVEITLHAKLGIEPSRPFVVAVADPDGQVFARTNYEVYFRKYVLGAVTHGFEPDGVMPCWVSQMAGSMKETLGYNDVIAFDWAQRSRLPIPGMAILAGDELATEIVNKVTSLIGSGNFGPNDLVDLHLVGHSRGAVVISRALIDLQEYESQNYVPHLSGGYVEMNMLDPHPARNDPYVPEFSVSLDPIGLLILPHVLDFQALANDPEPVVPAIVNEAEVVWQRAPVSSLSGFERYLNLWGEPVQGARDYFLAPSNYPGVGHSEVPQWFEDNIIEGGIQFGCPVTPSFIDTNLIAIDQVYRVVLHRAAELTGLQYWTGLLNQGISLAQVTSAIWQSPEHRGIEVDSLYATFLHRPADAGGRAGWVSALESGMTNSAIEEYFLTSPEYRAAHPDARSFVEGLYSDVLGRPADPAGLRIGEAFAGSPLGRALLSYFLLNSHEEMRREVVGFYALLLNRAPDAAGEQAWMGALQILRLSTDTLAEAFLASDEFTNRALIGAY